MNNVRLHTHASGPVVRELTNMGQRAKKYDGDATITSRPKRVFASTPGRVLPLVPLVYRFVCVYVSVCLCVC